MSSAGVAQQINKTISINDLSTRFQYHEITAALQCAGNRRHDMRSRVNDVEGIDWGDGAVMNAQWGGFLLRDVLSDVGVNESRHTGGLHVEFVCSTQHTQDDAYYGSSIPLSMALDPERECLLATHMNGDVLTAEHGYPLRVIVPGVIGARSVKWLDKITISNQESSNFYQKRDYKVLTGDVAEKVKQVGDDPEERGKIMEEVEPLMDNPINSVVAVPGEDGASITRGVNERVQVKGYAIPHGKDGPIVRVEVSIDEGKTWLDTDLLDDRDENNTHPSNKTGKRGKFSWVLWRCNIPVDEDQVGKEISIWSKATDQGGNTMNTERPHGEWNLRGVGYNAVEGRTNIKIV
jgi:sulfite oxidase